MAFSILAVVAIGGITLTPAVASAASAGPAVLAHSATPSPGDPDTTVTFTVTSGELLLTAPASVNLGGGAPGDTISGTIGSVTVTDDRALLNASWTTTASATDWSTGGGTPAETIPVADVTYDPGAITNTGIITATETPVALSATPQTVVSGTAGVGNNTATWEPNLTVSVPASAVNGLYTGTLTQSVS